MYDSVSFFVAEVLPNERNKRRKRRRIIWKFKRKTVRNVHVAIIAKRESRTMDTANSGKLDIHYFEVNLAQPIHKL